MSGPVAESSARRPGLLRRLFLCSTGSCPCRPGGNEKAFWGTCTICGRRAGEVRREAVRRYAEMEERDRRVRAALEVASQETGAFRDSCLPPACAAAPSLDALHPAFVEPVTGYMVRDGFNRMRADPRLGACAIFMSPDVIGPEEARVEVEIRLRRVIPEGEA